MGGQIVTIATELFYGDSRLNREPERFSYCERKHKNTQDNTRKDISVYEFISDCAVNYACPE